MDKKYYVVEYRHCDCGCIGCPGDKLLYHFEHTRIEECRDFMLRYATELEAYTEMMVKDNGNGMVIRIHLMNGKIATRKFRIQDSIY